jgi:hypothetical protein
MLDLKATRKLPPEIVALEKEVAQNGPAPAQSSAAPHNVP